jgi:drug/metabolite transporter (DMT)-like permease
VAAAHAASAVNFPSHLLIPLACALVYAVGALSVKRAAAWRIGLWRTSFVANVTVGLLAQAFWLAADGPVLWSLWWQPVVAGAAFLGGQVCTFLALGRGDVSVATPVLGTKILLVAWLSAWLLIEPVPWRWWLAAALSTGAILLLGRGPIGQRRRVWSTVLQASLSALCFALADVLVQKWAPGWGAGPFLPAMFAVVAVASIGFVPLFSAPLREIPPLAWRWVLAGAALISLQSMGIAFTLARWGDATAVNVVYSSRGLWSVALVWVVGHWFANEERSAGAGVLRARLAGAGLMIAAIALVLV